MLRCITHYIVKGLIFACLIALIAGLGCFNIPLDVRLFCIILVLGLVTSAIDSIAVTMYEYVNKWIGTAIAMIIIYGYISGGSNTYLDLDESIEIESLHSGSSPKFKIFSKK